MGRTIKRSDLDKLKRLCRRYNPYTQYIDSYTQELAARATNDEVTAEFAEIANRYTGASREVYGFELADMQSANDKTLEQNVLAFLAKRADERGNDNAV